MSFQVCRKNHQGTSALAQGLEERWGGSLTDSQSDVGLFPVPHPSKERSTGDLLGVLRRVWRRADNTGLHKCSLSPLPTTGCEDCRMKSKWFLTSFIPKHAVMQGKVLAGQLGDQGSTQGQEGFETRTKNQNQVVAVTVTVQRVPLAYNQLHFERGPDGTSWRAVCSLIYRTLSLRQIKWKILLRLPLILDHLPVGLSVSQHGFTVTPFLVREGIIPARKTGIKTPKMRQENLCYALKNPTSPWNFTALRSYYSNFLVSIVPQ